MPGPHAHLADERLAGCAVDAGRADRAFGTHGAFGTRGAFGAWDRVHEDDHDIAIGGVGDELVELFGRKHAPRLELLGECGGLVIGLRGRRFRLQQRIRRALGGDLHQKRDARDGECRW